MTRSDEDLQLCMAAYGKMLKAHSHIPQHWIIKQHQHVKS